MVTNTDSKLTTQSIFDAVNKVQSLQKAWSAQHLLIPHSRPSRPWSFPQLLDAFHWLRIHQTLQGMVFPSHSLRVPLVCQRNFWKPVGGDRAVSSGPSSDFGKVFFGDVLDGSGGDDVRLGVVAPVVPGFDAG